MPTITCAECGAPFTPTNTRHARRFCGKDCHTAFKNRRSVRGGLLYDFLMTQRYDRMHEDEARQLVQSLCRAFRDADKALRAGRPSWRPFNEAKTFLPVAYGISGDGR